MGCRYLSDPNVGTVFYCSVTDVAFGPVMEGDTWAAAFRGWLSVDPRSIPVNALIDDWSAFRSSHVSCEGCDAAILAAGERCAICGWVTGEQKDGAK